MDTGSGCGFGTSFKGKGNPLNQELARLKRELAQVKKEWDFLSAIWQRQCTEPSFCTRMGDVRKGGVHSPDGFHLSLAHSVRVAFPMEIAELPNPGSVAFFSSRAEVPASADDGNLVE
jgi:hypothetical protein